MKRLLVVLILAALMAIGCKSGGDKFVGRWVAVMNTYGKGGTTSIIKNGDSYLLTFENSPISSVPMFYDKTKDVLVGTAEGTSMALNYVDSTKHILISNTGGGMFNEKIELQKAK